MSIFYNAFISYRHHPEDIRAATQIHRALERFRVPKALRGKVKLPMRLFRDKDELPITSNLTGDISEALENSDYLIVICSVHTKESMWVQREIETFLKTHSHDKVLTVLVNGEPYEVIPEILLYREVTDPETGETVRLPIEPLSCDLRMGHRKAMKEELPRLAAALLHCGYDELRQRQKQYRMKQLLALISAALAASVALSAYFLHTAITIRNANIQIQKNLDQALRNQSSFLATAAEERMEKGDRLTALSLLLEALPSEDNPRPYVADAEYVLTEALGVYANRETLAAQGALIPSESAVVTDFVQTQDGKTVFMKDVRGMITGWDTQTLEKICTMEPDGGVDEFIGTTHQSGVLVSLLSGKQVCCFSREGRLLWQLEDIVDVILSGDGKTVCAIRIPEQDTRELIMADSETGNLLCSPLPLNPSPSGGLAQSFVLDEPRTEGALIPMIYWNSGSTFCLLNPVTGEVTEQFALAGNPRTGCETEDGSLVVMIGDGTGMMNGTYGGNRFTSSPSGSDIFCYDSAGQLLWTSKITTCLYNSQYTLCQVPGSDRIFCQAGDTLQLISCVDGSVLQSCSTTGAVREIFLVTETEVMGILEDGRIFGYAYQGNFCDAIDYNLENNLRAAAFGSTVFTLSWNSTQVTAYRFSEVFNQWEFPLGELRYMGQLHTAGNDLAFVTLDEICLFDVHQQDFRWRIPQNYLDLCGFSEDGSILWAKDGYTEVCAISSGSGEMTEYTVPREWEGQYLDIKEEPRLYDNDFWFLASSEQKLRLFRFRPLTGETACWEVLSTDVEIPREVADSAESIAGLETYLEIHREMNDGAEPENAEKIRRMLEVLPDFLQKANEARLVDVQGNRAWILDGEGTLHQLDLKTGTCSVLLEGLTALPPVAVRESDGALAVAVDSCVLIFAPGETEPRSVQLSYERGGSLCFRGEELLVLCDSGDMLRFDENLQQLSRTELTVDSLFSSELFSAYRYPKDITWEFTGDNRLYLNLFQVMNVVDCDQWSRSCYIPGCILYDAQGDQFLCRSGYVIQGYPRYDTEELMQLARQQLGTFRLSQGQKDAYGIE